MTETYHKWMDDPTISRLLGQLGLSALGEPEQEILERVVKIEGLLKKRVSISQSEYTAWKHRRSLVNLGIASNVRSASIKAQVIADALASQDFTDVGAAHPEFDGDASHRHGLGDISIREQD